MERRLLDSYPASRLKSTVLKIAHHGSETSSTRPFLEAVDPDVVVVCSGRRKYGDIILPDASTLARFCCHDDGIRIFRTDFNDEQEGRTSTTDADGDHVVIRTNGTELEVTALSAGTFTHVSTCAPACSE